MQAQRDRWRAWAIEKKVGIGFGFALALLLILGLVSYQTTLKLDRTESEDTPIDLALDQLDKISSELKDTASSERGYLITGDQQYIEQYQALILSIDRDVADLRTMVANNAVFRQKLNTIAPMIAAEEATMSQLYESRRQLGLQPVAQAALVNRSQRLIDKILQRIDDLEQQETEILRRKTNESAARDQAVNLSITFGSFVAILLAALMINRDFVERKRADQALRESAARFRRLAENALDMIYRYRILPTPGYEYVSPAATAITGYQPEDFYADPDLGHKLVHPEDQGLIVAPNHPSDASAPLTVRWLHKDGRVIWTNQQRVLINDLDGNVVAIEGIVRDVSERMQAYQLLEWRVEERTHEIERRRQVAEGLRDILTILNSNRPLDEILDSILAHACRLLGTDAGVVYHLQEPGDLLCVQAECGLDADDARTAIPLEWGALGAAVLKRQLVAVPNALAPQPDCTLDQPQQARLAALFRRYGALLVVPLLVKDDIYGAIALYYHQPREFTREETELAVAFGDQTALAIENARLRTQAEQIAVAAERSRLARDLHDAVTQTLFSTSMIADVLPRLWERDQNEARRRLVELRQLTRGALAEMRSLLLELRPAALAEVGLGELLRLLTEAISGRIHVPITLAIDGQSLLQPDMQIALYRIAQEALNNVARHANASQVTVSLCDRGAVTELHISDDGCGFDPSDVALEHLGLNIMRERAEALGAELRIISQPGAGTQITISCPHGDLVDRGARGLNSALRPTAVARSGGGI